MRSCRRTLSRLGTLGTPDQTQVLHDVLWILAGELYPRGLRYCR
jgi:hypothetical protein